MVDWMEVGRKGRKVVRYFSLDIWAGVGLSMKSGNEEERYC